ncbi:MAG: NrfA- nitrite reduction protein, partial [Burkholderiales bacterium 12-64-5]
MTEQSCIDCHGAELKQSRDTHPKAKFNDPIKAVLLQKINAQNCLTCHVEHQEERTHPMGVTVPEDYCFHCHQDVAKGRPSHTGLAFNTCANAGCHNYHDNTAIYENFLNKHTNESPLLSQPVNPLRKLQQWLRDNEAAADKRLTATEADAPPELQDAAATAAWAASPHALRGVNCSGCHLTTSKDSTNKPTAQAWVRTPSHDACKACHDQEVQGFLQGLHGVRLAVGLPPMTPREAELPMHAAAGHRELNCSACHAAHNPDVARAAYEACIQCHNDEHSSQYARSSHHQLWKDELSGSAGEGTGVSCATCHMPRDADGL